jgi:hypothetical protein
MASDRSEAMAYYPLGWIGQPRARVEMRQYTIRLAVASEHAWRRLLDDLRWEGNIDTLSADWVAGEGEALVECFGDVASVLDALKAAGQDGAVLGIARA